MIAAAAFSFFAHWPRSPAGLLGSLHDVAQDALDAVCARLEGALDMDIGWAYLRLLALAERLFRLAVRVADGRGFPEPRPSPGEGAARASSGRRVALPRIAFLDLLALQVPGAEALRGRLAALLADPEMAGLIAAEPAAWRAAAPLARLLGLPRPPRPAPPDREPEPGAEDEPRRNPPHRPEPAGEDLRAQASGPRASGPQALRPEGADPPAHGG